VPRWGKLSVCQFSEQEITDRLGRGTASRYLASYLEELGVTSILDEDHYVDRHFVEDFTSYYARSFNAPNPHCGRLHFFKDIDSDHLAEQLKTAYRSEADRQTVEIALQTRYAGFVVRRPLTGARIGRTVLCTYDSDNARRHYTVVRSYKVNVSGIRFEVRGLAYQQQDRGAAVCASTALWSALQQVASLSGNRTPTPSEITRAAASPFPVSQGLGSSQMATALSTLGYGAELLAPNMGSELFRAKLVACLLSHLPVILLLRNERGGHAVTVTGFSDPRELAKVIINPGLPPLLMKSGSTDVLYVHDDNLGSHAHYELFETSDKAPRLGLGWLRLPKPRKPKTEPQLMLRRGRTNKPPLSWWKVDELTIVGALVPKPLKLRLPIDDLFLSLVQLRRLIEQELPGLELHYSARFATGVNYRDELFHHTFNDDDKQDFHERLALPRFVGVISVLYGNSLWVDVILDVSEVAREPGKPPVLALACPGIPFKSKAHANLMGVANHFDCPIITGPARAPVERT
jgi:hypothetical protein